MSFDDIIDRRNTDCAKWDKMEDLYGVSPDEGLAMWVADMDFASPKVITDAVKAMADHGVYGYYGDDASYREAITWWMKNRHDWDVDPSHIFTTQGLVNAVAMCLEVYTNPGDDIVLFTPVYHAFARVIKGAGRKVVECEMTVEDGRYALDFDAYDAQMTGAEKMLILCSPHNPGGTVWTRDELAAVVAFAKRHDLLIVSDEIHHDLVMPGHKHIPMANIDGAAERLIMLTAPSKTFNTAGPHTGHVTIADDSLRAPFAKRMSELAMAPNTFGIMMTRAAYSAEGAAWVDDLVAYLDGNRQVFDDRVNQIPGLRSMPLASTYLAWVDFSGTGMARDEVIRRVQQEAKIAPNHGETFGKGGEGYLRFNLATPRARIEEACARLEKAFGDLQ